MPLEELPRIDEHTATAAAPPEAVWNAALHTMRTSFASLPPRSVARLLGCDPAVSTSAWDRGEAGATVPGFRIVAADRPHLLVVAGDHRFSRYGIVFRIEPAPEGARLCLESRGAFPGLHGGLYRLAVIGSGGHAIAVERLVRQIARAAERRPT